jgi:GDPmannose 4,6-dehydratase
MDGIAPMLKKALVTGIAGQDGSYLAELLLSKGYEVHGVVRRTSQLHRERTDAVRRTAEAYGQQLHLHYGNINDPLGLVRIIQAAKPDEIYNLASESHVGISFEEPENSAVVNGIGALRLLEIIRHCSPTTRFYQASTSEIFGGHSPAIPCPVTPCLLDEASPFAPRSPYGAAKQYAHTVTKLYRDSFGLHSSNGILFNHESPRRGVNFVSRKITSSLATFRSDSSVPLLLGNLDSRRDWGYAPDYVQAMWLMVQRETPDDYVIATGETHSVREFVEIAATICGFTIEWRGTGLDEIGIDRGSGAVVVRIDPRFFRPNDHTNACGSSAKALKQLNWSPSVTFHRLVEIMMLSELYGEQL